MCDSWAGGSSQGCYPPTGHTASQKIGLGGVQPLHKDTQDGLLKVSVRARGDLKGRKRSNVSPVQISSWLRLNSFHLEKCLEALGTRCVHGQLFRALLGTVWTWSEKCISLRRCSAPLPSAPADFPRSWKESNDFVSSSPCPSHHGFVNLYLLHWNLSLFFILSFLLWFFLRFTVQVLTKTNPPSIGIRLANGETT